MVMYWKNCCVTEKLENKKFSIEVDKYSFQYEYQERFSGNIWKLYYNNKIVCYFEPFEGVTYEEMKFHLMEKKLEKKIYTKENIRVYALPLFQYQSKYKIIYTVDGAKFNCWNDDMQCVDEKEAVKKRLSQLYQYISEDALKKASEESWK